MLHTISEELFRIDTDLLAGSGIPVVTIGQAVLPDLACDRVAISGKDNGTKTARFIIEHGFRDIAYISVSPRTAVDDFLNPLRQELSGSGIALSLDKTFIFDAPHGYMNPPNPFIDVQNETARLLQRGFDCDLLICGSDYIAVGALRAILSAGRRVPRDIEVLSAYRICADGLVLFTITGFDFNPAYQGQLAAELLVRRIKGYTGPWRFITVRRV